ILGAIRRHRAGRNEAQRVAQRLDDTPAGTPKPRIDTDNANRFLHVQTLVPSTGPCQRNVNKTKTSTSGATRGEISSLHLEFRKLNLHGGMIKTTYSEAFHGSLLHPRPFTRC